MPGGDYGKNPPGVNNKSHGPVQGNPAIPGHGGDHDNGGAGGAKNHRVTVGHIRLTLQLLMAACYG